jgi:hypothetical protein
MTVPRLWRIVSIASSSASSLSTVRPSPRLVVAVREVEADRPGRAAAGPFPQDSELALWHETLGFGDLSADDGERLLGVSVRDPGWRLQPGQEFAGPR